MTITMKIRTLIPAIIALVMLVGGPFGFGTMCDTDPRGGLICYCCSATGKNCTMISCAGCCGAHAGSVADRWSPEMIPESFPAIISREDRVRRRGSHPVAGNRLP